MANSFKHRLDALASDFNKELAKVRKDHAFARIQVKNEEVAAFLKAERLAHCSLKRSNTVIMEHDTLFFVENITPTEAYRLGYNHRVIVEEDRCPPEEN